VALEEKMDFKGIHSAPHDAECLIRRARDKAMTGDHIAAEISLKKAIKKYPHYAEAYALLGNCQDCLEKYDEAILSYDKALQIDPDHAEVWFNKGMSLKKMGKNIEATECVEKAINLYFGR
jgi:tetratricopeptide (TPR) repeat protein